MSKRTLYDQSKDPLSAVRGILYGAAFGLLGWAIVSLIVWGFTR